MMKYFLLLMHFVCTFALNAEPRLEISQGKLKGTVFKSRSGRKYSAFLGIPFAQPPIGNLRFRNPLPARNWNGVLNATNFGNVCLQPFQNGSIGSEDCLYLNIYTPPGAKQLPVMVWIHGGSFIGGSGNIFHGNYLLDKNIILITVNYRLGIFGFFTLGDYNSPGNFGLKDQVLALKWVQENIRAFGGDPRKVTLFGESAGGASVSLHAISKASNGLFHQYIIQSGSSLSPWTCQESSIFKEPVIKIAKMVNCPYNNSKILVNCLRGKKAKVLLNTDSAFDTSLGFAPVKWVPTIEPDNKFAFLADSPKNLIDKNQMKDLPFMSGIVTDEGLLITHSFYANEQIYNFTRNNVRQLLAFIADYFLALNNTKEFVTEVEKFYFNNSFNSSNKFEFLKGLTEVISDGGFIYPELRMVQKVTPKMKNPNYLYSFGFAFSPENNGVAHGSDVEYLFPSSNVNLQMSEIMVDLWTSFAINGKPTSDKLNKPDIWKPYNIENNIHLQIGNINNNMDPTITLSNSFYSKRMNFWQTKYPI
ncbi:esterase FE4-like [Leptopilina heterotoma]|uniref:esterase FE4-like n=1 Tax=Leptopilina heterotoma TaxID=63436 RepID=UPI001CA82542|nr:esterase FE4-like [Leptopilina heterotoma]